MRYAIGDVQGCYAELRALIRACRFNADRDRLWFVGDLVNRGPDSLRVLRFVRALGDNAVVVLGNHDLHLLAVAFGGQRKLRPDDNLRPVLKARDRDRLLEWLLTRPLAHHDARRGDLLVHAGIIPQWSARKVAGLAREVEAAWLRSPREVFDHMYGNRPNRWRENLRGTDRWRFIINVLTRLRYCTAGGRIDLNLKAAPGSEPRGIAPWFIHRTRRQRGARVICGHWSTLGYLDSRGVLSLDTGCVWGGRLTAARLDGPAKPPLSTGCKAHQLPVSD